jgi:uncharacterized protein
VAPNNKLNVSNNGTFAEVAIDMSGFSFPGALGDNLTINGEPFDLQIDYPTFADLRDGILANTTVTAAVNVDVDNTNEIFTLTGAVAGTSISVTFVGPGISVSGVPTGLAPDKTLYNRIRTAVDAYAMELYPSAMMAGIYCAVDTARGVWKAPANVGVTLVDSLNRTVKDSDQENLNVDPTSGKSIDVIRTFPGRGDLVWGARTLDGNSNEWRYVSVRRTFLFIEDSCKKACSPSLNRMTRTHGFAFRA